MTDMTTGLVPVANALRGVAAGFITADSPEPGALTPRFHIHGNPVTAAGIDGRCLQALYELGLISLVYPKNSAPQGPVVIAEALTHRHTPTTRNSTVIVGDMRSGMKRGQTVADQVIDKIN